MEKLWNYGDLPAQFTAPDAARIVVIPVPYDGTSTWGKGADKGPGAIIDASANMELYDIETDSQPYLNGIHTAPQLATAASPEEMVQRVHKAVCRWLNADKFPVVIGGEHSITIGAVKAAAEKYDELTVLQLDAHSDLRDEYLGSKYNHACVMARVREICPIMQVGIRSMDFSEKQSLMPDCIFFADHIHGQTDWIGPCLSGLKKNVYVTIDLDVFDPSVMPSTGTPEPGGLLWYEVLKLLKMTCETKNVVAFDVVELCPNEINKAPDFMAAKLIYKFLSYRFGDPDGKK